jgi:hypothetical protein
VLIDTIIIIHVIIYKMIFFNFKILKILSALQCKILCYLSRIIGDVYHPVFTVVFCMFLELFTYSIIISFSFYICFVLSS